MLDTLSHGSSSLLANKRLLWLVSQIDERIDKSLIRKDLFLIHTFYRSRKLDNSPLFDLTPQKQECNSFF